MRRRAALAFRGFPARADGRSEHRTLPRTLESSLVLNQRALPFGLRELDIGFDPASREDRLCNLRSQIPRDIRTTEQTIVVRQRRRLLAAQMRDRHVHVRLA